MLHTKSQRSLTLRFKRIFLSVLPYMGMVVFDAVSDQYFQCLFTTEFSTEIWKKERSPPKTPKLEMDCPNR